MRPKYILWTLVAVIWSAWYAFDPQARFPHAQTRAVDSSAGNTMIGASLNAGRESGPALAEAKSGFASDSRMR